MKTNETLDMLIGFKVKFKTNEKTMYSFFTITSDSNESTTQTIIKHQESKCKGHHIILEKQPTTKKEEMITILKEYIKHLITELTENPVIPFTIEHETTIVQILFPPNTQSNNIEKIFNKIIENEAKTQPVLNAFLETIEKDEQQPQIKKQPENTETTNNIKLEKLYKAAKEKELIQKYGKINMLKLAQKMKYHGEIINKK